MNLDFFEEQEHPRWPAALKVYQTLKAKGHQCYFSGGCVRDLLLERLPNDFDLATDATTEQIKALFPKHLNMGEQFGTIAVVTTDTEDQSFTVEVTHFRGEGTYQDGRHPDHVTPATAEEDAQRRDFTMNALFLDPELNPPEPKTSNNKTGATKTTPNSKSSGNQKQIIDYVNGQEDIKNRLIRTVGDPKERFNEDHLRILRAVRFQSQLGFEIHPDTRQAIAAQAHTITKLSKERIHQELNKFFEGAHLLKALGTLESTGLHKVIFSEFNMDFPVLTQFKHCLQVRLNNPSYEVDPTENLLSVLVALSLLSDPKDLTHQNNSSNSTKKLNKIAASKAKLVEVEAPQVISITNTFHDTPAQKRKDQLQNLNLSKQRQTHTLGNLNLLKNILENTTTVKDYKSMEQKTHSSFLSLLKPGLSKEHQAPLIEFTKTFYKCAGSDLKLPAPLLKAQELMEKGYQGQQLGSLLDQLHYLQILGHITSSEEAWQWLQDHPLGQ